MRRLVCLLILSCFLASCAYHPQLKPVIKVPDFYDFKVREGGLDIAVDPYEKPYKIKYLFNTDITEKGILALHLIIWNNGISTYDLTPAKIFIRSLDGREYKPMPADQVSERVLPSTIERVLGFGAMGTALIFFTVPFAAGAAVDSEMAKRNIRKDYEAKQLREGAIKPKGLFHGFLFFDLPGGQEAFNKPYYFYIEGLKNTETGENLNTQIRIELDHE